MHICLSNDNVSAVMRNECRSTSKEFGTPLLHTTLSMCISWFMLQGLPSIPFYLRSSGKANYGSKQLTSMSFREHKRFCFQQFSCVALNFRCVLSAVETTYEDFSITEVRRISKRSNLFLLQTLLLPMKVWWFAIYICLRKFFHYTFPFSLYFQCAG